MECFPVLLRAYVIALAIFAMSYPVCIQAAEGKIISLFLWRIFFFFTDLKKLSQTMKDFTMFSELAFFMLTFIKFLLCQSQFFCLYS